MAWFKPQSKLDITYLVGIVIKGLSGILELATGVLVIFVSPALLHNLLAFATQREIVEDPRDKFANFLLQSSAHFNAANKTFIVVYLWIHGIIKLIAVYGLLRNKMWAFPFSLITLGLLVVYQLYSIFVHVTIGMIILTVFDLFVLWLIWREYKLALARNEQLSTDLT